MTPPERTIDADEEDRAQVHARISARQAVMKGMDRDALADAFMVEAVKLTFGVEDAEAARLAPGVEEQRLPLLVTHHLTPAGEGACLRCARDGLGHAEGGGGPPQGLAPAAPAQSRAAAGEHRLGAREL